MLTQWFRNQSLAYLDHWLTYQYQPSLALHLPEVILVGTLPRMAAMH